jgi:hypothetical protein
MGALSRVLRALSSFDGEEEAIKSTNNALHVADFGDHPGEDGLLDRTWGGGLAYASALITGDTLIYTGANAIAGYCVHVATATAAIELRDATSAGSGTVRVTIPAGKAIGEYLFPQAINCDTGIYADYAASATGTISILRVKP